MKIKFLGIDIFTAPMYNICGKNDTFQNMYPKADFQL